MYNSQSGVQFWDFCTQRDEALPEKEMFIKGFNTGMTWRGPTEQEESFKFCEVLWTFNPKNCINWEFLEKTQFYPETTLDAGNTAQRCLMG